MSELSESNGDLTAVFGLLRVELKSAFEQKAKCGESVTHKILLNFCATPARPRRACAFRLHRLPPDKFAIAKGR